MTGTEVATTAGGFKGADVDGLDKLAHDFTAAAQVVDMVKTACEIIVAAASFFGPFAAAFIAYLKGTVIPWLTKISEALKAMSKLLSLHSAAQKDTSSSSTSLPSYTGTPNLPSTSTHDAPQIGGTVAPASPTTGPATPPASTVIAPPALGGGVPGAAGTTGTGTTGAGSTGAGSTGAGSTGAGSTPPIVQTITAITGLVTAIDHLIHPNSGSGTTTPTTPVDGTGGTVGGDVPVTTPGTTLPGTTDPGTTDPGTTVPGTTDPGTPGGTVPGGTDTGGTVPGGTVPSAPVSLGGIDLSALHPLHPGDTVGVISIPVDIAPDGTVTPLIHTPFDPVTGGTSPIGTPTTGSPVASLPGTGVAPTGVLDGTVANPIHAAAHDAAVAAANPHSLGSSGGGGSTGGGGSAGGGGSFGGGGDSTAPNLLPSAPAAPQPDATLAAHTTPAADPELRTERVGSHDGLFTGLGQATGIGAGAAALARAALAEARQHADGSTAGASPSPFDSDSDAAAQSSVFSGSIG